MALALKSRKPVASVRRSVSEELWPLRPDRDPRAPPDAIELRNGGGIFLPVKCRFRARVLLLNDRGQHALPHPGKSRTQPRRHGGVGGTIQEVDGQHRFDRALGLGHASKREQAERPVLVDGHAIRRLAARRIEPAEHGQRVFVVRRCVEVAGGRDALLARAGPAA